MIFIAVCGFALINQYVSISGFFHQAVMMSGSDLSPVGYIDSFWKPRDYAHKLGQHVNCPYTDSYELLECLRNNETVTWQAILDAQESVEPNVSVFLFQNHCSCKLFFTINFINYFLS